MTRGRSRGKRTKRTRTSSTRRITNWAGGRIAAPFTLKDQDEPRRAEIVLWMDTGRDLIVGQDVVVDDEIPGAVGRTLTAALELPLAGPMKPPGRIRVADAALASEVRAVVGDQIPVEVAPTPQLDRVLEEMIRTMPGESPAPSYLEGGRIAPEVVADLFAAAKELYRVGPWHAVGEDDVARLDIPSLGVEGGCVSISGGVDGNYALYLFPSLSGFNVYMESNFFEVSSDRLALNFHLCDGIPPEMQSEIEQHDWPVAGPEACPTITRHEADETLLPPDEREVKIMAKCAWAIARLFLAYGAGFEDEAPPPARKTYRDRDGAEVHVCFPYDYDELFELEDLEDEEEDEEDDVTIAALEPARRPDHKPSHKLGRNDPCHCGSGLKYKRCHLDADREEQSSVAGPLAVHEIGSRLYFILTDYAKSLLGDRWRDGMEDFGDPEHTEDLSIPWSIYGLRFDGKTVAEHFLDRRGDRLSRPERIWLQAQCTAWLSVWEVVAVKPGTGMKLADLLSGETRIVAETLASRTLVQHDAILARVLDYEGLSVLSGVYPRSLPPIETGEVIRRARGRLRRKRAVPVERLRDDAFGSYLIRRWEEAVGKYDARRKARPTLMTGDGEPFLVTKDRFAIAPGGRPAVERRLAAMDDVEPETADEEGSSYIFFDDPSRQRSRPLRSVLGHARVTDKALEIETHSRERADTLRERLEAACGERIQHRGRVHSDPLSNKAKQAAPEDALPSLPSLPPELAGVMLEVKRQHYSTWADVPLPALDGETPRQAAQTEAGRQAVEILIKEMEYMEQRTQGEAPFDFAELRRSLGLD